jgi:peptidoglycan/LPS O-acetylase OafA/YrhL
MSENSANLDLLRSVAVITVVIDHLVPTLIVYGVDVPTPIRELTWHIGQAGVLAFFVHTSLVLMRSLERLRASDRSHWVGRFYARRGFRIYPLALVCVVAMVLLRWPESTWHPRTPVSTRMLVANLFLVQNLVTGHSVLAPLWSLPYEVEMYALLPALYCLARRRDSIYWLLGLLVVTTVGGYGLRKLEHGHMNLAGYVPCFLAGVLCYAMTERVRPRIAARWWPLAVVGLVMIYCGAHSISDPLIYWFGWLYCLALAVLIPWFVDSERAWLNRVVQAGATYSYGFYLLHVPALYVVFGLWRPASLAVALVGFVGLATALAVVAYHLIEAPMVRLGRRLTN